MTNTRIFSIILSKFGHWSELCLVILLKFNQSLRISFYYIILVLCLTDSLRIKSGGERLLNVKKIAKQ